MTSSSETQIDKEEMTNFKADASVGAVRGRNVYELTSRRQLVTGLGNSLHKVIQQRFFDPTSPYRRRVHDAELHLLAGGGYELWIPARGTSPAVHVPILFVAKPAPLSGGIHGGSSGICSELLYLSFRGNEESLFCGPEIPRFSRNDK